MVKQQKWAKEEVEVHLRYDGPDVDDGSMSVEDIVPVLQGFSSAYGKIASAKDPQSQHNIRIAGVRPGSADIVLEVWRFLGENVDAITSLGIVGGGAATIVTLILGVIKIKRHVGKGHYEEKIASENNIDLKNSGNISITVSLEMFNIFKSRQLDSDISRMVRPLEEDHIDTVKLSARLPDGQLVNEEIDAEEKPNFEVEETTTVTTREVTLVVRLDSAFKGTNSGHLYLGGGQRVYYKYVGDDPTKLHRIFGHSGPLRARCIAEMDANLIVTKIQILDLEIMQGGLFDTSV